MYVRRIRHGSTRDTQKVLARNATLQYSHSVTGRGDASTPFELGGGNIVEDKDYHFLGLTLDEVKAFIQFAVDMNAIHHLELWGKQLGPCLSDHARDRLKEQILKPMTAERATAVLAVDKLSRGLGGSDYALIDSLCGEVTHGEAPKPADVTMDESKVALFSVYAESRVHRGVYFFDQKFYGATAEYRASLRADEITEGKSRTHLRRPKRKTLVLPGYPGETVDASGKPCKNPSRATMPKRDKVLTHPSDQAQ